MRIIFFTKTISYTGGREKAICNLANYLITENYEVLIIAYDGELKPAFPLSDKVPLDLWPLKGKAIQKNVFDKLKVFLSDIHTYKKRKSFFRQDDYLVASDHICATVLHYSLPAFRKRIIIWEHITYLLTTSWFWKTIRKTVYPKAKKVIALNKEEEFFYKSINCDTLCIPNPVSVFEKNSSTQPLNFVWVGALTIDKGVDDLMNLALLLKKEKLNIQIEVYGTGDNAGKLVSFINENSLSDILVLKGKSDDLKNIYQNKTALLITSKHECFPTIILEAFSYGVPVISFDCPTGPRNMIIDGENGSLIQSRNAEDVKNKMREFLSNSLLHMQMSDAAYLSSLQYQAKDIYPQWKKIFV